MKLKNKIKHIHNAPRREYEPFLHGHSQSFQDIFVLSVLRAKKSGYYLEVGGNKPISINNTYMLEKHYNWKGFSIEFEEGYKPSWEKSDRSNDCLFADAITFDYRREFELRDFPKQIDYLSIDIDPAPNTLAALKKIPLDEYRFSVITYEHDSYTSGFSSCEESRHILKSLGYSLVCKDVKNCGNAFEDWYVDPSSVQEEDYCEFLSDGEEAFKIFYEGEE